MGRVRVRRTGRGVTQRPSSRHAGLRSGIQKKEKEKALDSRVRGNDAVGHRIPEDLSTAA